MLKRDVDAAKVYAYGAETVSEVHSALETQVCSSSLDDFCEDGHQHAHCFTVKQFDGPIQDVVPNEVIPHIDVAGASL